LIETLKDNEPLVRASAATALGALGAEAKAALPALTELQKDQATVVKLAADGAVSKISSSGSAARSR
jgi:HEAT repeat protein